MSHASIASDAEARIVSKIDVAFVCRFLDAGMTALSRAVAAGVQKAPRHEVAGSLALAVQRALWGFNGRAGLNDRMRAADQPAGEIGIVY